MPPHIPPLPPRFTAERVLTAEPRSTTVLARDRVLDRLVVIKLVELGTAHEDGVAERFDREAQAAASVNHPNVVTVFDYGSHAGARYLVLRHVEGESLRAYLNRRGRVSAGEAIRIAGQILAGLGAIHAAGVVHRDITPENIIAGADGLLRITNFGIAVASSERGRSMQALSWGTPAYMAPEQTFGYGATPAADLYAVGVLLFEMLTSELPFPLGASPALAFARVATPPAIRDVAPDVDVPPQLEAVARRALATNPDDRFRTAAEMAGALLVPSATLEAATAPPQPLETSAPAPPIPPALQPASVPPIHPHRSALWLNAAVPVLLAALVAALIGGAATSRFWRDNGAPPIAESAASTSQPTATSVREELAAVIETPTPAPSLPAPAPTEGLHAILAATKLPAAGPSPTPSPTAAPPAATKKPKRKKTPTPTSSAISKSFTARDWRGGFAGNQAWYGRPWVAIYGAQSQYPQATLSFTLDAAPSGDATLALDGLDDEWPGNVAIEVTVDGVSIFSGPSPFASWDGQGQGENAHWTTGLFTVPPGALRAGDNVITVANLEPAANFGTGPYVLLSDARLTGS